MHIFCLVPWPAITCILRQFGLPLAVRNGGVSPPSAPDRLGSLSARMCLYPTRPFDFPRPVNITSLCCVPLQRKLHVHESATWCVPLSWCAVCVEHCSSASLEFLALFCTIVHNVIRYAEFVAATLPDLLDLLIKFTLPLSPPLRCAIPGNYYR